MRSDKIFVWDMLFIDSRGASKKIEDCEFVSLSTAGRIAGEVLVHLRPRFQRFAAMSTVGDFKSPFYFQNPDAEWTAARPFVIAFRTYAENNVRAAQKFAALPKRDQESAIPVCADQEFFQVRIPFVVGQF